MRIKYVAIIGHFGGDQPFNDGQTVKTRVLYEELSARTGWAIRRVDTYYRNRRPVRLLLQSLAALMTNRDIIVLLSGNGMRFYFPLLSFFARVFHTRVYHDVIGGNLSDYVQRYPKFAGYLRSFRVNWVETRGVMERLREQGIENCEVLPNFKALRPVSPEELSTDYKPPYRFCTFSRVMREKGIEDAIDAICAVNGKRGDVAALDIYGPIEPGYEDAFARALERGGGSIRYGGVVRQEACTDTLRDYYMLLFPTFWHGEGMPGTIVDALSAGVPVIARRWRYCDEMLTNGVTGYVYDFDEPERLAPLIEYAITHTEETVAMKRSCLEKAMEYSAERAMSRVLKALEEP